MSSKFHFGKHAGVLLADCTDIPYMEFMMDKVDKHFRRQIIKQIQKLKQESSENPDELNNQQNNNNNMDVSGILKVKGTAEQVSDKFKKREFVLTDNSSQYPQHISFQLTQDKCGLIDNMAVGSEIKVHFNLRGREWTSPKGEVKHFNTLEAWRIEGGVNAGTAKAPETAQQQSAAMTEDDLPF